MDPDGNEVQVLAEGESDGGESGDTGGMNCHFHAGVECVPLILSSHYLRCRAN